MRAAAIGFALVAGAGSAIAGPTGDWQAWQSELHRQCPANHVDWIYGDGYDELAGGFVRTLPLQTRKKMDAIADYQHRCASETMGFSCELAVNLDAFRRLGLLKKFVAFGCNHYRCSEPALCVARHAAGE
jgi:hypothetical protein